MKKHAVTFQPSGRTGPITDGITALDAARALGVGIESVCGGKGICGKCKVVVQEGASNVSELSDTEKRFIRHAGGSPARLACECRIHGDVTFFVPEASRAGKQVVMKGAREVTVGLEPAVKKYFVQLAPPSLQDMGEGDKERLVKALREQYGFNDLSLDLSVLRGLQDTLRKSGWNVTVTVWRGQEILKVEPGFVEPAYGIAIDLGTTTVAGYLCDLTLGKVINTFSMLNPQVIHGGDVMSRISFSMAEPDGLAIMQREARDCVNEIIKKLSAGIGGPETILDMTAVCNTAMHHIFLGIDPLNIGRAPFIPAVSMPVDIKARELGININRSSYMHILPVIAGFVGPDNAAVLIAEEPYKQDETVLIIDIGTNGELLLGNKDVIYSASCATGPAFEGAQIKHGMRAAPGAIESIKIIKDGEPSFKTIGDTKARGICGSGVIDAVAELLRAGIIDKTGTFRKGLDIGRLRKDPEGRTEYVVANADDTSIGSDITITQRDVRAVQLAKGALYAGARLMMRKMGVDRVDKVILAGAFGSYINKESALILGMFPACPLDNIFAVGNAAGDGAVMALLNVDKREEAEKETRKIKYIEIAMEPDFQDEFLAAMDIPGPI